MERHERIGKVIGNRGRAIIIVKTEDGKLYELPRMSAIKFKGDDVTFSFHTAREVKK